MFNESSPTESYLLEALSVTDGQQKNKKTYH